MARKRLGTPDLNICIVPLFQLDFTRCCMHSKNFVSFDENFPRTFIPIYLTHQCMLTGVDVAFNSL